jgi:3-hydroxyisobutyrate dehydrogenase-like beta-hydroxyacid dehydrogenase
MTQQKMTQQTIGFVGFGEVAPVLSGKLREQGADIAVYDIVLNKPGGRELLEQRAQSPGIEFVGLEQLMERSNVIISTVTTQSSRLVAGECAKWLKPGQIYLDLNSTSPSIKQEIAEMVRPSGADFVEGAILGAIGATKERTPILTGGERGPEIADLLTTLGLRVTYYSAEIGKASTFKMLRSIFSKGLEALLGEFLIAGRKAGIMDDLWKDVMELMTTQPFDKVASNWIQTHALACERRYYEMLQVKETMEELGIDPVMTQGTIAFFERSLGLDFKQQFTHKPDSMVEVIDYMNRKLP